MKKIIKWIIIFLIVILIILIDSIYKKHNLMFISNNDKESLMEILEINESESFVPIYIYSHSGFHDIQGCYEIKFEISIQDYENNNLNYNEESYYEELADCTHKELKDDSTYICILRRSKWGKNIEIYNQIHSWNLNRTKL